MQLGGAERGMRQYLDVGYGGERLCCSYGHILPVAAISRCRIGGVI